MMSTIDKLASSVGRRDEAPNEELAKEIVATSDTQAIKELVDGLSHKNKDIQSDCIKVLYEAGSVQPALIQAYTDKFAGLLNSKNNRLQWGAMHALNCITAVDPNSIYTILPQLAAAAEKGSVITKDNYIGILAKLGSVKKYADDIFALLNEQLLGCAVNQFPMYAELTMPVVDAHNKPAFISTLQLRLGDLEQESKRKRIEKVIKKVKAK